MPDAAATPTKPTSPPHVGLHIVLGVLCLTLLPIAWSGRPLWKLGGRTCAILALIAVGYALGVAYLSRQRNSSSNGLLQWLLVSAAAVVPALLAVLAWHPTFSRVAILATLPLSLVLSWITLSRWKRPGLQSALLVAPVAAAVLAQAALGAGWVGQATSKPSAVRSDLRTSLYDLQVTAYRHWIPRPQTNQGAIDLFADRYLLATGDGDLYVVAPHGARLDVEHLALRIPINLSAFAQAVAGTTVATTWFRTADILTRTTPRGIQVFASHHYWNTEQKCYVLRVSATEGSVQEFSTQPASLKWSTVFDSKPCVPLARGDHPENFYGIENGGRMLLQDDHHLLLTVGDHGLNGWDSAVEGDTPQDLQKSYGKIIDIDVNDLSSTVYSYGHRNPQGLARTASGQLWSTEHGPQGGDELNRIERGHNYGWPVATFGVEYGTFAWPLAKEPGGHEGFDNPYYTWIPSIGVSNLIAVNSPSFPRWRGDFLIGSLAGQTLWRMRVRDERIVLAEQIGLGERIRDIIEGHGGDLVVWTDSESLLFLHPASADVASGQSMFTICAGCHVPLNAQMKPIGPSLRNIVGRPVASLGGFEYSPALKAFGGNWTQQRLDQFLANPAATAPGTSMHFPGISDAASRQQLIEYLNDAKAKLDEPPPPREI